MDDGQKPKRGSLNSDTPAVAICLPARDSVPREVGLAKEPSLGHCDTPPPPAARTGYPAPPYALRGTPPLTEAPYSLVTPNRISVNCFGIVRIASRRRGTLRIPQTVFTRYRGLAILGNDCRRVLGSIPAPR